MASPFQGGGGGGGGRPKAFQAYQGEQVQSLAPGYLETLTNAYAQIGQGIAGLGKGIAGGMTARVEKDERDKEKAKKDAIAQATARAYAETKVRGKDIDDEVASGTLIRGEDGTVTVNPNGPTKPEHIDQEKLDIYNKYLAKPDGFADGKAEAFLATEEIKMKAAKAKQDSEDAALERQVKLSRMEAERVAADATATKVKLDVAAFYDGLANQIAMQGNNSLAAGDFNGADTAFARANEVKMKGQSIVESALSGRLAAVGGAPAGLNASRYAEPAAPSSERAVLGSQASTVAINPALAPQPAPAPAATPAPAAEAPSPAAQGQMERIERERQARNAQGSAEEQIPASGVQPSQPTRVAPAVSPSDVMRRGVPATAPAAAPAAQPAPSATPSEATTPAATQTTAAAPAVQPVTPAERQRQFQSETVALQNQIANTKAAAERMARSGSPYAGQALAQVKDLEGRLVERLKVADKVVPSAKDTREALAKFPQVGNWVHMTRANALTGIKDLASPAARDALINLANDPIAYGYEGSMAEVQDAVRDSSLLRQNLTETLGAIEKRIQSGDSITDRFALTTTDLETFAKGEVGQKFLLASLRKAIVSGGNFSDADREFILEAIPYLNSANPTKSAPLMREVALTLGRMAGRMYDSTMESRGFVYAPGKSQMRDDKEAKLRSEFDTKVSPAPNTDAEVQDLVNRIRGNASANGYRYSPEVQAAAAALAPTTAPGYRPSQNQQTPSMGPR